MRTQEANHGIPNDIAESHYRATECWGFYCHVADLSRAMAEGSGAREIYAKIVASQLPQIQGWDSPFFSESAAADIMKSTMDRANPQPTAHEVAYALAEHAVSSLGAAGVWFGCGEDALPSFESGQVEVDWLLKSTLGNLSQDLTEKREKYVEQQLEARLRMEAFAAAEYRERLSNADERESRVNSRRTSTAAIKIAMDAAKLSQKHPGMSFKDIGIELLKKDYRLLRKYREQGSIPRSTVKDWVNKGKVELEKSE